MNEKDIVNYLKEKYQARMIILHGSRASGVFDDLSDWDLFVFTESDKAGYSEKIDNTHLDVDLVKLPLDKDFILKTFVGPVRDAKILYDSLGLAEDLIRVTKDSRENGPDKLSTQDFVNRKLKAERFLNRIIRYKNNQLVQFYYLGYFYEIVIRYWFELRQEWPLPMSESIDYIKERDKEFFNLLENIVEKRDVQDSCEKIYKRLFD